MTCRECAEARRFSADSVYCIQYGIIISDRHECRLPGAKEKASDGGTSETGPSDEGERSRNIYEL